MNNLKHIILFSLISIMIGSSGIALKLHKKAMLRPVGLNDLGNISYFFDFNKKNFKGSNLSFKTPSNLFFYHKNSSFYFLDISKKYDFSFIEEVINNTSEKTPLFFYSNSQYTLSELNKFVSSFLNDDRKTSFKHIETKSICYQHFCTENMIGLRVGREERI